MDTTKLVVSQEVFIFGVGRLLGKVVAVTASGVDVQTEKDYIALFHFDENGEETDHSRYIRCGSVLNGPCPSLLPWVIEEASPEEIASWKLKYLK